MAQRNYDVGHRCSDVRTYDDRNCIGEEGRFCGYQKDNRGSGRRRALDHRSNEHPDTEADKGILHRTNEDIRKCLFSRSEQLVETLETRPHQLDTYYEEIYCEEEDNQVEPLIGLEVPKKRERTLLGFRSEFIVGSPLPLISRPRSFLSHNGLHIPRVY